MSANSTKKYMTSIGQKTGISVASVKVRRMEMTVDRVADNLFIISALGKWKSGGDGGEFEVGEE